MVAGETLLVVVIYKDLSLFFNATLLFVFLTQKTLSRPIVILSVAEYQKLAFGRHQLLLINK